MALPEAAILSYPNPTPNPTPNPNPNLKPNQAAILSQRASQGGDLAAQLWPYGAPDLEDEPAAG